ncbi:MAG: PAC2 family protein [Chloroflexota bacterium]
MKGNVGNMGVRLFAEPKLRDPVMIACWPGIGNVGLIAVDTLHGQLKAEKIGEVESWQFFYPRKLVIKQGLLVDMQFPPTTIYHGKGNTRDLLFVLGDEQPTEGGGMYAAGRKAYEMGSLVVDVAESFGCRRVYTSGAAVSPTHHSLRPRVWAVTSGQELSDSLSSYHNVVPMGEAMGSDEGASITGLNGLLLGIAKKRGLEAVCLMGEVPDYLSGAGFPYPKASRSVLEVLGQLADVPVDFGVIDKMVGQMEGVVEGLYARLPSEIVERLEQRKSALESHSEGISEEDERWIKEHIEDLFKRGSEGDERGG